MLAGFKRDRKGKRKRDKIYSSDFNLYNTPFIYV